MKMRRTIANTILKGAERIANWLDPLPDHVPVGNDQEFRAALQREAARNLARAYGDECEKIRIEQERDAQQRLRTIK